MVMFPDGDGNAWTPPAPDAEAPPPLHKDNPKHVGNEVEGATGFLPAEHPGRQIKRYDVPENLFKHWGPDLNGGSKPVPRPNDSPKEGADLALYVTPDARL